MRPVEQLPTVTVDAAPADAVIGSVDLTPIRDEAGVVIDHVITRAVGVGETVLFGELPAARWRRLSDFHPLRRAFVADLLERAAGNTPSTFVMRAAERAMLANLTTSENGTLSITFARVDVFAAPRPPAVSERIDRLTTMLNAVSDGVAMYEPVRDERGAVVDFVCLEMSDVDSVVPADVQIGRRLLEMWPEMASNGSFDGYRSAMETGETWAPHAFLYVRDEQRYAYRLRAASVDGRLVVSWHDTLVDAEPVGGEPTGEPLTLRQTAILQAIADGRTTADIAAQSYLSQHTVRNEVRRILAKLGVRSRAEAVRVGLTEGLIGGQSSSG